MFSSDKKNFGVRITGDDIELMNEFAAAFNDNSDEEIKSDRQFFTVLLESAISRKKPREVSKKEDVELIEFLKAENSSLRSQNETLSNDCISASDELNECKKQLTANLESANEDRNAYENLINSLRKEVSELKTLQSKAPADNEIRLLLTPFYSQLLDAMLASKELVAGIEKYKDKTPLISVSANNPKESKINLILNSIVCAATGYKFFGHLKYTKVFEIYSKMQNKA